MHKLYQAGAILVGTINELSVLVTSGKVLLKTHNNDQTDCDGCNNLDVKKVLLENTGDLRQMKSCFVRSATSGRNDKLTMI